MNTNTPLGVDALRAAAASRTVQRIIVHCSATPAGRDVTAADIDSWHRQRGFDCIGYHFLVRLDGTIEAGRQLRKAGAHCLGQNARSVGVCYAGGLDKSGKPADTRTPAQRKALIDLIAALCQAFPGATVHGHREFAAKACPCFDAANEYASLTTR